MCVQLDDVKQLTDYSNRLGAESWEMVGGSGSGGMTVGETRIWCFKRQVP